VAIEIEVLHPKCEALLQSESCTVERHDDQAAVLVNARADDDLDVWCSQGRAPRVSARSTPGGSVKYPETSLLDIDFAQVFLSFLVLLFSLTVHEAAHAWSADRLGDSTARMLGRVSLNPAVHVDLIGTIVFPLIALLTHLPVIGWAKPVPVNMTNLRGNWRQKFMGIAAAGPASNLAIAVVASFILRVVALGDLELSPAAAATSQLTSLLETAVIMNILLAVFNMVPVPPLDGGNVLSGLLRGAAADTFNQLRPYGFMILYGLMFTGTLTTIITPPARFLLSWLL
jgi:Zn-dependent protease